jgi:hypothetical protein
LYPPGSTVTVSAKLLAEYPDLDASATDPATVAMKLEQQRQADELEAALATHAKVSEELSRTASERHPEAVTSRKKKDI